MSKPQDFFGAAPKTVLNKPFMHVQDQKGTNVSGGASAVGDNQRDINTVLINDIAGASLGTNTVTLPAGTYYFEAYATCYQARRNQLHIAVDGVKSLSGQSSFSNATNGENLPTPVVGQLTLLASSSITLVHYMEDVETNGKGLQINNGDTEIYTDLRIWKLDSNIETPVFSDPDMVGARPLLHVTTAESEGSLPTDGTTALPLANIKVNEISGTSITNNKILLLAGIYDVTARIQVQQSGSGLCNATANLRNLAGEVLAGSSNVIQAQYDSGDIHIFSRVTLTEADELYITVAATGSPVFSAGTVDSVVVKVEQLDTLRQTPILDDPQMIGKSPLFHAVDNKSIDTTVVQGISTAVLTTVLNNEISGAILSNSQITLPAGEYRIEAGSAMNSSNTNPSSLSLHKVVGDEVIPLAIRGSMIDDYASCAGNFTLVETTAVYLKRFQNAATADMNWSEPPVPTAANYVRIWKLDAQRLTPVLSNNNLYPLPGGVYNTGNILGLEYEYTDANTITVQAGTCTDSINELQLVANIAQTVSIPAVANTVYNLFLCDDGVVRTDTDVDGNGLVLFRLRWIGFVGTDDSGNIRIFNMCDDEIHWTNVSQALIGANVISSAWQLIDSALWDEKLPQPRVSMIRPAGASSGESASLLASYDANAVAHFISYYTSTNTGDTGSESWGSRNHQERLIPFKDGNIYFRHNGTSTKNVWLRAVKVKR